MIPAIQIQKEALIVKAIEAKGFSLDDEQGIKENFSISEYPDGSSNFMFKARVLLPSKKNPKVRRWRFVSEPLIHFFPLETKEIERNEDIVIQFNQKYKCYFERGVGTNGISRKV